MDTQLLESITQMTDIIKKQQETIDKLTTKDVQYVHIEKISTEELNKRLNEAPIVPYKTTGVNEQKDVAMSGITEGTWKGNVKDAPTSQRPVMPPPPPCRVIKAPSFCGIFSKGEQQ